MRDGGVAVSSMRHTVTVAVALLLCTLALWRTRGDAPSSTGVQKLPQPNAPLQPLAQQVRRIETALSYLGQPLPASDHQEINDAVAAPDQEDAVRRLQTTLDTYVLAFARLSGLAVEYVILEILSRDSGQRSAQIAFNVGQGTQDVGFRNDISILFTALPARTVTIRLRDETGRPAIASFLIRDRSNRVYPNSTKRL